MELKIFDQNSKLICANKNVLIFDGIGTLLRVMEGSVSTNPTFSKAEIGYSTTLPPTPGDAKLLTSFPSDGSAVVESTTDITVQSINENRDSSNPKFTMDVKITFSFTTTVQFNEVALYISTDPPANHQLFAYSNYDTPQVLTAANYTFLWTFIFSI